MRSGQFSVLLFGLLDKIFIFLDEALARSGERFPHGIAHLFHRHRSRGAFRALKILILLDPAELRLVLFECRITAVHLYDALYLKLTRFQNLWRMPRPAYEVPIFLDVLH